MASGNGQGQAASAPAAEYSSSRAARMVDDERSYMAHGELLLLLLVGAFALLFASLFVCLYLRRRREAQAHRRRDDTDRTAAPGTVSSVNFKG